MLPRQVEEYIALRRALGFKFQYTADLVRAFGRFAHERGDKHVRWRTAVDWARQAQSKESAGRRLGAVHKLAHFLRAEDRRHQDIPKRYFRPRGCRPMPYIYSPAEVATLLTHAAEIEPPGSFRAAMFTTFYSLLAVTGLRTSEALRLRLGDFRDGGLFILETKFHKSRWLPLHRTTVAGLERYLDMRKRVPCRTDHFFVSPRTGRAPKYAVVWWTFRSLCARAGIGAHSPSGRKPRIHDLRHTFAVRALERSPSGREAVERHTAALSTYLGHTNARYTYWYLHRTPQLLRGIARECERTAEGRSR